MDPTLATCPNFGVHLCAPDRPADRRGSRGRPRQRDRPSRSEARQRQHHYGGNRQGPGLRSGQGRRTGRRCRQRDDRVPHACPAGDPGRDHPGHGRLHVSGVDGHFGFPLLLGIKPKRINKLGRESLSTHNPDFRSQKGLYSGYVEFSWNSSGEWKAPNASSCRVSGTAFAQHGKGSVRERCGNEYPPDWPAIASAVKNAAGWECIRCGHPNDQRTWSVRTDEGDRCLPTFRQPEPALRGVADGVPDWLDRTRTNRVDRLRCLGNGVVPATAAVAFVMLARRAGLRWLLEPAA